MHIPLAGARSYQPIYFAFMKVILLSFAFALAIVTSRAAQASSNPLPTPKPADGRVATLQVRVRPDRAGWTYALGEPAKFHITIVGDQEPVDGVAITYRV